MIRINQIKLKPEQGMGGQEPEVLENKIRKLLRLKTGEPFMYEIVKRSIDARKKPDIFSFVFCRFLPRSVFSF